MANATAVTVTFAFITLLYPALSQMKRLTCFRNKKQYFGYTNLGSHVPFQITKSNRSCTYGHMWALTLLHNFFREWTANGAVKELNLVCPLILDVPNIKKSFQDDLLISFPLLLSLLMIGQEKMIAKDSNTSSLQSSILTKCFIITSQACDLMTKCFHHYLASLSY